MILLGELPDVKGALPEHSQLQEYQSWGMDLSTCKPHLSHQPLNLDIHNSSPFILSYTHNNGLRAGHFLSINDQLGLMALACALSHQLLPTGH